MESFCFTFLLFDYEITYGDRLTMPVMQNTKEKFEDLVWLKCFNRLVGQLQKMLAEEKTMNKNNQKNKKQKTKEQSSA